MAGWDFAANQRGSFGRQQLNRRVSGVEIAAMLRATITSAHGTE
jgi:hypothetical protein